MFGSLFAKPNQADISNRKSRALKSFEHIFKDMIPGLPGGGNWPKDLEGAKILDVHERQRQAAFKAWATRRRAAGKKPPEEKIKQSSGGLSPEVVKLDSEVATIAKKTIPNLSYSSFERINHDGGVNESGFIKTPDGRKMFVKVSPHEEVSAEVGAWGVAKAIGWGDLQMPTHLTKFNGKEAIVRDLMPDGKVWVRAGSDRQQKALGDKERMHRVALFEYVVADTDDRHWKNYWVDKDDKLWPIDLARGFQSTVSHNDYRNVYRPQTYLGDLPLEKVKQVLDAKAGILAAAKKVNPYAMGNKNKDTAEEWTQKRLEVIEAAYNEAIEKRLRTVNLNKHIDKAKVNF